MFDTSFIILFLTTLLFSTSLVRAENNAYDGCQTNLPSVYITAPAPSGQSNYTSGDQCWQYCFNANNPTPAVAGRTNYRHSLWQESTAKCLCTDKYQTVDGQVNGVPNKCSIPSAFDNRIVQTTFVKYPSCYAAVPAGISMSSITGPDSCSIKCGTAINMIFYMDQKVSTQPVFSPLRCQFMLTFRFSYLFLSIRTINIPVDAVLSAPSPPRPPSAVPTPTS